jgi:hypothetical protein
MFDLEKSIVNWRRELITAGVTAGDILDELENHLREDVEQQVRSGVDAATAFNAALKRVGEPGALKAEFAKASTDTPTLLPKIFRSFCFVSAPFVLLVGGWAFWDSETGLAERVLGMVAVSGIAFYLGGLPFWYRSLPSPENPRVCAALKLLSFIFCGWTVLALLDAVQVVQLHLGNTLAMICWDGYVGFAATIFAYVCRGPAGGINSDALPDPVAGDFTELAQASLEAAREEAVRFHHDYIGTEHILLGILATESGLLMDIFRKSFVDRDTVRREVEKLVGTSPDHKLTQEIPYTPRAKRAFGFAAREARAMNHSFISAEHLFLGLLIESEGVAGLVLRSLGFDVENARAEILRGFGPNGDDGSFPMVAQ